MNHRPVAGKEAVEDAGGGDIDEDAGDQGAQDGLAGGQGAGGQGGAQIVQGDGRGGGAGQAGVQIGQAEGELTALGFALGQAGSQGGGIGRRLDGIQDAGHGAVGGDELVGQGIALGEQGRALGIELGGQGGGLGGEVGGGEDLIEHGVGDGGLQGVGIEAGEVAGVAGFAGATEVKAPTLARVAIGGDARGDGIAHQGGATASADGQAGEQVGGASAQYSMSFHGMGENPLTNR